MEFLHNVKENFQGLVMKSESVHDSQYNAMSSAAVIEFHTYIIEALLSTFRKFTMYVKIKTLFKLHLLCACF